MDTEQRLAQMMRILKRNQHPVRQTFPPRQGFCPKHCFGDFRQRIWNVPKF
jgi:hypothetical protein